MATSMGPSRPTIATPKGQQIPTNYGALSTLVTVFFFWGFIAAGNSVFIPFCKHYFHLDQFQSQLVDFAFYTAYYIGALILFLYGAFGGNDLVAKWGYKRSIVYGLLFSALGAAVMIFAVNANIFAGMLVGLFIVALGFSLQQTAAQPFAITLGDPSTGTSRVNLGGGVNSFGTMIGPIVVAFALFGTTAAITDEKIQSLGLSKVIVLYAGVGALFIAAAALFYFSKKVPSGISTEKTERSNKALYTLLIMTVLLLFMFVPVFNSYKTDPTTLSDIEKHNLETYRMKWLFGALAVVVVGLLLANFSARRKPEGWGAMQYPQLVLGMLGIFVYVGVEVTIVSNLSELLKQPAFGSYPSSQVAPFISMYWGSLMIGRWTGAISAFDFKSSTRQTLTLLVPIVAFGIVIGVNAISQYDVTPLYYY
ncbi:MAG TPA: MFS transporter, partial [Flavisolibacter sp.]|nr:MFS transporter [Flavisolibacter sp.]